MTDSSNNNERKFLDQFGPVLYSPSTKGTVKTSEALSGKTVLLYFSAHWCPPCRRFTPMLISFYNKKMKTDDTFELVFVSLDRTEAQYNEYVADMPWKCIPFQSEEANKQKIAMKYGASGIPHLVVVNNNSERKVITSDGVGEVQLDPEGNNFPWRPKSFKEIWPEKYLTKNGLVDSTTLENKHLMLYFSAHWCPPCRRFTPTLSEFYKKLKEKRPDDFELVFVSSDRDEGSFNEYFGEMPFCALPFEEREAKGLLAKRFDVSGIPSLQILGPLTDSGDRPLINDNVRSAVEAGDLEDFPFHPKPYQDLATGADGINEHRSLVVFCENEDDDEQKDIIEAIQKVSVKISSSKKESGEGDDATIRFFYATEPAGLATQIRGVIKMENKYEDVIMALLDIPDNGGYYISDKKEITEDAIEAFLANPGDRQQISR